MIKCLKDPKRVKNLILFFHKVFFLLDENPKDKLKQLQWEIEHLMSLNTLLIIKDRLFFPQKYKKLVDNKNCCRVVNAVFFKRD